MQQVRQVREALAAKPVVEGAGVHLKRAFGFNEVPLFDPFLMLDDFEGDDPALYQAGFPWHPHRGIETITYLLEGSVEHGDSLGNSGVIEAGSVQWMTAGSGIIHQEMPKGNEKGRLHGFQLWANLPADNKMMPPRYRDLKAADIPSVRLGEAASAKVICGQAAGVAGPADDIVIDPLFLDLSIAPGGLVGLPLDPKHNVLIYLVEGLASFGGDGLEFYGPKTVLALGEGDELFAMAAREGARFLLAAGPPLDEPVAWRGPIVMNTQEQLDTAFREYRDGGFIK